MTSDPPPMATLQPLTPPALDRLVRRCLAKDPDQRWQSAADVAESLRDVSRAAEAPTPAPRERPAIRRRRTPAALSVVGLILLAAAVLAWGAIARFGPRPPASVQFTLTMPHGTSISRQVATQILAAAPEGGFVVEGFGGDRTQLFWGDLNQSTVWALPGTEGARNPFLSADGRWLGFWQDGAIRKLPLRSGRYSRAARPSRWPHARRFCGERRGVPTAPSCTAVPAAAYGRYPRLAGRPVN